MTVPYGGIDSPTIGASSLNGIWTFSGWGLSNTSAISRVAVLIDGISYGNDASDGASRPDVCQGHPGAVGCPTGNMGWIYIFDSTHLANGTHNLTITIYDSAVPAQTVQYTRAFTVSNTLPFGSIDIPAVGASSLNGLLTFAGWGPSDSSAISRVAVLIEGISYGNDASYGASRPDVCQGWPGAVGFPAGICQVFHTRPSSLD